MRSVAYLSMAVLCQAVAAGPGAEQPAPFSAAREIPPGWQHVTLPRVPRANRYDLVEEQGRTVLQVRSETSASSLEYRLDVDPARTPLLRWRWKVSAALPESDLRSKSRDDYAARVYVFFDYDSSRLPLDEQMALALARAIHGANLPAAALCYVWGSAQPVGTIGPNPYTDRLRMIVVESGPERAGQWIDEHRDLAADFQAAFGEPAPRITGVAVGADTDNTGSAVTTWFGDLWFEAK